MELGYILFALCIKCYHLLLSGNQLDRKIIQLPFKSYLLHLLKIKRVSVDVFPLMIRRLSSR